MKRFMINKSQIGLIFCDGSLRKIVKKPGKHIAFRGEVYVAERADYILPTGLSVSELESMRGRGLVSEYIINSGHVGALFIDGAFVKILENGRHWFMSIDKVLDVKTMDIRKQTMHINGQEILTADKVDLRLNFAITFIVNNPEKALTEYDKYDEALYLLFQLALREYISAKTLDEILEQKSQLGSQFLSILKPREKEYATLFVEAGLKDIILPGDIKAILNTVLIAQKQAQANVIMRREETASTRSLLNTAKLLDENKTLYRLKELEYLEKIYQNVSHISLGAGSDSLEQLTKIIGKAK